MSDDIEVYLRIRETRRISAVADGMERVLTAFIFEKLDSGEWKADRSVSVAETELVDNPHRDMVLRRSLFESLADECMLRGER